MNKNNVHIHPETGDIGNCDAKKRKCPYIQNNDNHFESREEAQKFYETEQSMIYDPQSIKVRQNQYTDAALESSMIYSGKVPKWFKQEATFLQEDLYGTKPELIDVIDSPIGKLAVVYEENAGNQGDVHTGMRMGTRFSEISYRNFKTGEVVTHLKTGLVDEKSEALSYGTDEWRGLRRMRFSSSFYDMQSSEDEMGEFDNSKPFVNIYWTEPPELDTEEKLQKFINNAQRKLNLPQNTHGMNMQELQKELSNVQNVANERLSKYREERKSATIDQSRIDDERLRGIGIGSSMYVYLSRKLAEDGKTLDSSSLQTDEAKRVWKRMAADTRIPIQVVRVVMGGKVYPKYRIDYRTK